MAVCSATMRGARAWARTHATFSRRRRWCPPRPQLKHIALPDAACCIRVTHERRRHRVGRAGWAPHIQQTVPGLLLPERDGGALPTACSRVRRALPSGRAPAPSVLACANACAAANLPRAAARCSWYCSMNGHGCCLCAAQPWPVRAEPLHTVVEGMRRHQRLCVAPAPHCEVA